MLKPPPTIKKRSLRRARASLKNGGESSRPGVFPDDYVFSDADFNRRRVLFFIAANDNAEFPSLNLPKIKINPVPRSFSFSENNL